MSYDTESFLDNYNIWNEKEGYKLQKHIRISLKKENGKAIIEVSDNGKGMDTKDVEKIFNAFYSTKNNPGRIGLGLYIVKDLILKMGFNIRVNSAKGKGTVFTIFAEE